MAGRGGKATRRFDAAQLYYAEHCRVERLETRLVCRCGPSRYRDHPPFVIHCPLSIVKARRQSCELVSMRNLDNHLDENRSFSSTASTMQDLASWWQRAFALVIDTIVIGVVAGVVLLITAIVNFYLTGPISTPSSAVRGGSSTSAISTTSDVYWIELIAIGIASTLYFAILDGRSQTLGKMALGIAVRDQTTGKLIGTPRALVRWIIFIVLWGVFFIPGILNALSPLWNRRRQAWHDHAVGSVVLERD